MYLPASSYQGGTSRDNTPEKKKGIPLMLPSFLPTNDLNICSSFSMKNTKECLPIVGHLPSLHAPESRDTCNIFTGKEQFSSMKRGMRRGVHTFEENSSFKLSPYDTPKNWEPEGNFDQKAAKLDIARVTSSLPKTEQLNFSSDSKALPPVKTLQCNHKRGRPRKLILDPSTNEYIDSSHPNYKNLNKLIKDTQSDTLRDSGLKHDPNEGQSHASYDSLDSKAVKDLILKKDKRGRPRKFPIEETGLKIRGIRVNGNKNKKKRYINSFNEGNKSTNKLIGKPKSINDLTN